MRFEKAKENITLKVKRDLLMMGGNTQHLDWCYDRPSQRKRYLYYSIYNDINDYLKDTNDYIVDYGILTYNKNIFTLLVFTHNGRKFYITPSHNYEL